MAYPYQGPIYMPGQVIYPQAVPQPAGQLEQLRAAQGAAYQSPQQSGNGITWVQGEEGAKAYIVAPGASVMLMDSEGQSFYIKSADASGMPMPLRVFDYTERQIVAKASQSQQELVQAQACNYATQDDIARCAAEIEALRGQIDAMRRAGGKAPARNNVKEDEQHVKPTV